MKTSVASQKVSTYKSWILRAASVFGMTVVCGTTAAQPDSSDNATTTRPSSSSFRPTPDARGSGIPSLRLDDGWGKVRAEGDWQHSNAGARGGALPRQLDQQSPMSSLVAPDSVGTLEKNSQCMCCVFLRTIAWVRL